jgi:hypothetical protein
VQDGLLAERLPDGDLAVFLAIIVPEAVPANQKATLLPISFLARAMIRKFLRGMVWVSFEKVSESCNTGRPLIFF